MLNPEIAARLQAYQTAIESAEGQIERVRKAIGALRSHAGETRRAAWVAAGGCARCWGAGQIVTWSTLDGPSWTEYGPCDAPMCAAVRETIPALARPAPCTVWGGGYSAQVRDDSRADHGCPEAAILGAAHDALTAYRDALQAAITPEKGDRVVVVRGRKVPIGTVGILFWVGAGSYLPRSRGGGYTGDRGGVRVAGQADPAWTAISNLACFPSADPDPAPAMPAGFAALVEGIASGRFPVIPADAPIVAPGSLGRALAVIAPEGPSSPAAGLSGGEGCTRFALLEVSEGRALSPAEIAPAPEGATRFGLLEID